MRISLSDLGEDLLTEIFRFLEPWELINCELVSKQWRTCAQQPRLWSKLDFSSCPHPELVTSEVVLRLIRRGIDFHYRGRNVENLDISACRIMIPCILYTLKLCTNLRVLRLAHTHQMFVEQEMRRPGLVNCDIQYVQAPNRVGLASS